MNKESIKQKIQSNDGNCLIYGCASLVVIGIIGVIAVSFGVRYMYIQFRDTYTDTQAMELPIVEVADSDRDAIIERYDTWVDAMENDGEKTTLVLTEQDINVLIQHHEDMEEFADNVYISIEDSTVTGQVSIPLDEFPGFDGRYFNGSVDFEVELNNGRLSVYVVGASVNGEPVPDEAMQQVSNENLAKDANKDEDFQELVEQVESIEIKAGTVTIIPADSDAPELEDEEDEEKEAA